MSTTTIVGHDPEYIFPEQTYHVNIFNKQILDKQILTTVTSMHANVNNWIGKVESEHKADPFRLIVGFDVKLSASASVALVVLCVYRSYLIFELAYAQSIPPSLTRFLTHNSNTFVGVGIDSKLDWLRQQYALGDGTRHHDLGSLAAERYTREDLKEAGLSQLRTFFYGIDLQRPAVDGNWDEDELSSENVHHATIDAYVCYELGSYLVYPIRK